MLEEELESISHRILHLKDLICITLSEIKLHPNIKTNYQKLTSYTKEIKQLDKKLKKAQKEAIKNEQREN